MRRKKFFPIIALVPYLLISFYLRPLNAQNEIRGKILDASTGSPLSFANIIMENSSLGTTSGENGEFMLSSAKFPITLIISYVGYKTTKFYVLSSDEFLIILIQPFSYPLQEISVYSKKSFSTLSNETELKSDQVKKFAGTSKDALRTIQLMPGVSANNEASAKSSVRGGTFDENLVLINGVEVFNPFHLKPVAMASVGIFNIDMIRSVDFSAGGFGAEYGNALSSLLKIDYAGGSKEKYSGKADLSLVDFSFLLNGPIDSSSAFNIGFRKSYLDYLIKWTNVRTDVFAGYYDFQGQVDYVFSSKSKMKFNFIYAHDNAEQNQNQEFSVINNYQRIAGKQTLTTAERYKKQPFWGQYDIGLLSLVSENIFSSSVVGKTSLSFYSEIENEKSTHADTTKYRYKDLSSYWSVYTHNADLKDYIEIKTLSVKQDFLFQMTPSLLMKVGVGFQNILYDYERARVGIDKMTTNVDKYPSVITKTYPPDPQYNDSTSLSLSSYKLSGYIQQTYHAKENLMFEGGVRFDFFDINKQFLLSPRLTVAYKLPHEFVLRASWGMFVQPPTFKQLRSGESSKENTRYQESMHYIFGIDKSFDNNIASRLEFYHKKYAALIPVIKSGEGALSYGKKLNNATGYASGFDFQFNADFVWLYLWASYGFLITEEKTDLPGQNFYPRYTDQRHTFSLLTSFDLGNAWQIDFRGFYGSGYAYTPSHEVWDSNQKIIKWVTGTKNSEHYPAYIRIDLRLSKDFILFGKNFNLFADILNVLNRKNVLYLRYTYDEQGKPKVENKTLFGIIPTIGVSCSF